MRVSKTLSGLRRRELAIAGNIADMAEHVLFARDDRVGLITLNRPARLNAVAARMRVELPDVLREVAEDDSLRVLVITGAGRAFCAGADIEYLREVVEKQDWASVAALVEMGANAVSVLASLDKPVIAAVNGPAAGGGANLALACDIRIAAESASIGQTFNRIGLHPDWGGTYFLPRLVGHSKALELIFTGDMIDAREALRLGLFNHVVPDDQLMARTQELACRLADKPPLAIAAAKRAMRLSDRSDLPQMLAIELEHQLRQFRTEDVREGLAAFLEKRRPEYQGR